jgi:hypothetical protein
MAVFLDEDNMTSTAYEYSPPRDGKTGLDISQSLCPACGELIVMLRHGQFTNSNQYDYLTYPEVKLILLPVGSKERRLDSLAPQNIRDEFSEAVAVLPHSRKASAAISRRVLQSILRDTYKIKKKSLAAEIEEFIQLAHVPSYISGAVDAVRQIGNLAAHPVKDTHTGEILDVEPGEAEWLLEVIDSLSDFAFVQPKRLADRRAKLNEKLVAAGKEPMKGPVDESSVV